ncbi:MAG: PilZ domain-containing protein [Candidatus Omnitrophota bacterium]
MLIKKFPKEERRKYKRLDTIFPVEFQFLDKESHPQSDWYHGFSQDVSSAGICLVINNLSDKESLRIQSPHTNLVLQIHSPVSDNSFLAYARVVWIRKIKEIPFSQFIVGISFTRIDKREINRFIKQVIFKKILWRILQFLIIAILFYLAFMLINNFRLNARSLVAIDKYSKLLEQDLTLKQRYESLLVQRERLNQELSKKDLDIEILKGSLEKIDNAKDKEIAISEKELSESKKNIIQSEEDALYIKELKDKLEELKNIKEEETRDLKQEITLLQEQEKDLKNKISEIIAKEAELKEEFPPVEIEKEALSKDYAEQLYRWLKTHQNKKSGLIVSFEGDYNLKDISFVYDQALAIISYTLFGDYDRARRDLDFFVHTAKKNKEGGFYNAYYANAGDVSEFVAHAGPNLWLGIAILQYSHKSKDYSYLKIAEQIAGWIQSLQDKEGGIIGGKEISWYSTEHNLDAFAFFNGFYELTQDERYKKTADKILNWLKEYSYGNKSVPINRGKGDSTIATDTYAWSIAALGPEILESINMDPDGIMKFAIENCLVNANSTDRFGKSINVNGFDFAKYQHIPRGGVISCEWTAQMILSFNIMSDYYLKNKEFKKATYYQNKANEFIAELNKMIISSPSPFGQGTWCLPYASQENVNTGHGWYTPKGTNTGSVAATAYTIFAISKFNPLKLKNR